MRSSGILHFRPPSIAVVGLLIFAAGFWSRFEAHALCTYWVHMAGSPGTDLNATYTDGYKFDALVEISRVLLVLGAALCTAAAAAWLFVPAYRLPSEVNLSTSDLTAPSPPHPSPAT